MDLHRILGITAVTFLFIFPYHSNAASEHQAKPFCAKHKVPCTLKHFCVSYDNNNARLYYNNGEYYNYKHQGKFYNYVLRNNYYAYFANGVFFNYRQNGKNYTTCVQQQGYWQQGEWIVPPPICK